MNLNSMLATAALIFSFGAQAQTSGADHTAHHPAASTPTSAATSLTEGEVRKVDLEQKKVTLRHGPIQSLEMPAMTMVFRVADTKLLDNVKVGDKVRFAVERANGAFVVTALERAPQR
jgi:Cu(I)/Ag(I) efflux system protein CusF